MVSSASLAGIVFCILTSFLIPLIFCIVFLRKTHAGIKSVITGISTFILFALILEQILHYFALGMPSPVSETLNGSPWLFALYGAAAAGVFEEAGRLFAFKVILSREHERKHGIAYGVGHGGIESWILLSLASLNNLLISIMINNGTVQKLYEGTSAEKAVQLDSVIKQLTEADPSRFFLAGFERVFAFIIQIALSLLVLYAIRKGKYGYFLLAILLHMVLDFPAALYQKGVISIWFVEFWLLLFAVAGLIWIFKSQKLMQEDSAVPAMDIAKA